MRTNIYCYTKFNSKLAKQLNNRKVLIIKKKSFYEINWFKIHIFIANE